jgi:hypothetical protein
MDYGKLMVLHRKATWIIRLSLLLTLVLTIMGSEAVLLAGAVGGLISRLQRILKSRSESGEYGSYWISLFLSPVAGALIAWAGLTLIAVLRKLGILVFEDIKIDNLVNVTDPAILGLAVLFGFSERFFATLSGTITERIETNAANHRT